MHLWVSPVCICSLFATILHTQSLYYECGQENHEIFGKTREKNKEKNTTPNPETKSLAMGRSDWHTDIHTTLETKTQI